MKYRSTFVIWIIGRYNSKVFSDSVFFFFAKWCFHMTKAIYLICSQSCLLGNKQRFRFSMEQNWCFDGPLNVHWLFMGCRRLTIKKNGCLWVWNVRCVLQCESYWSSTLIDLEQREDFKVTTGTSVFWGPIKTIMVPLRKHVSEGLQSLCWVHP